VGNGPDGRSTSGYDSTASWEIDDLGKPAKPSKPSKPSTEKNRLGDKMPVLERGSKGLAVRILQGVLNGRGHKVSIDGIFGPQVQRAIRSFQATHKLAVDGICGPKTWNKLLDIS
jgi:peptidoglycan hydrolase-like protein with peptidoglycan-binding domain